MGVKTLELKGLIFNIQRFSIHDGPGIRTTVFLKGCPLRCLWCSNPESHEPFPTIIVRDIKCARCGSCALVCPVGAISFDSERGRVINWSACNQCLVCVDACKYQSLSICGRYMDVGEVLGEVLRDVPFYKNSGGGVTVSGGEPLLQWEFVSELCRTFRENKLHTALETCGFAPWKNFERVLEHVDLVLYDVKHLDPVKHREGTGVDNEIILGNLHKAAKKRPVWIRVPLIAGYNDSKEHIKSLVDLAREVDAKKISLLPYHEGGKSKCEQIGKAYPIPDAKAPPEEYVKELEKYITELGVEATIGH
ncbi:MAG: glycyl-radical enzyme activating protein [Candidatus Freyarchaeota archaeon]